MRRNWSLCWLEINLVGLNQIIKRSNTFWMSNCLLHLTRSLKVTNSIQVTMTIWDISDIISGNPIKKLKGKKMQRGQKKKKTFNENFVAIFQMVLSRVKCWRYTRFLFNKKNFYKKMSLKIPKIWRNWRNSLAANVWAVIFKNVIFPRTF